MNVQNNDMKPALLTADMTLLWFLFPFPQENVYPPAGVGPLPSHLTPCTSTESNLYLDNSLKTIIREPTLYIVHVHVPNLMSIFRRVGHLSK
jgi:hypothetical protein